MTELIDKKAITESRDILNVMELFELTPYISAENLIKFVDGLPTTTESEIRAKAKAEVIDEFAEKFVFQAVCQGCSGCCNCYELGRQMQCGEYQRYMEIAEQIKEE